MFNRRQLDDASHLNILELSRCYTVVGHALKQDVAHCERALIKDARLRLMYFLKLVQHAIYIMASKAGGGAITPPISICPDLWGQLEHPRAVYPSKVS